MKEEVSPPPPRSSRKLSRAFPNATEISPQYPRSFVLHKLLHVVFRAEHQQTGPQTSHALQSSFTIDNQFFGEAHSKDRNRVRHNIAQVLAVIWSANEIPPSIGVQASCGCRLAGTDLETRAKAPCFKDRRHIAITLLMGRPGPRPAEHAFAACALGRQWPACTQPDRGRGGGRRRRAEIIGPDGQL